MKKQFTAALCVAALGACSSMNGGAGGQSTAAEPKRTATAELRDAEGKMVGTASASDTGDGMGIRLNLAGLSGGTRGAHVHTTGACDAPKFESAGPHWNPAGAQHGRDNPAGAHAGDLPNIEIGQDGSGSLDFVLRGATLDGMLDADGAAIVVHQAADDYRTDPSGNSGARIACGVFR